MGYELHITRRNDWFGQGNDISSEEWLALVENDPDLHLQPKNGPLFVIFNDLSTNTTSWLDWSNGQISIKNPSDIFIKKMLVIARQLNAKVQGDDGEIYTDVTDVHRTIDTRERFNRYVQRLVLQIKGGSFLKKAPLPPFDVGDHVISITGEEGTILAIHRRAEHGCGTISIKFDDGREETRLLSTHGLSRYSENLKNITSPKRTP